MTTEEADDSELLTFFCEYCDFEFVSVPDGTGYQQAPCPQCQRVCVTADFDDQTRVAKRKAFTNFVVKLLWWPATVVEFWQARMGGKAPGAGELPPDRTMPPPAAGDPANPYRSPRSIGELHSEKFSAESLAVDLLRRLAINRRSVLAVSAAISLLALYHIFRFCWLIWRMTTEEGNIFGHWFPVVYWVYWILMTGLQGAYLASLSFAIWCYAQMLRPDDKEGAWPVTAFAEAHQKIWQSLIFGIGIYLFSAVADFMFPYLMNWVYV